MSGKQFTLNFTEVPAKAEPPAPKGREVKGVVIELYKCCIHFRRDVNKCYFLGSDIQPCVYEVNGAICPNYKTADKTICTKYKKKLVTWFDIVEWDKFPTAFGREMQETVDRFDEPVDTNRGTDANPI